MKRFFALLITVFAGLFISNKWRQKQKNKRYEIDSKCIVFQYENTDAKSVSIAGDFNDWNPDTDKMFNIGNGKWGLTLYLAPGRYEYKFVVDGEHWVEDPNAVEIVDDGYGGKRSVIYVDKV